MRALLALALLLILPATAAAQAPTVTTGPAQAIGVTNATLTGTVDPNGAATAYHFEYGTTTAYGLETPEQPAGAGLDPVAVQAAVQNLTSSTTYHYRLVAGSVNGPDRTFRTAGGLEPPGIAGLRVIDKTATSARVTARIDPNRSATTWHVEWGLSANFGRRTPDQALPVGDGDVAIVAALDALPSYRRVYWRVVAVNAAGITRSGRSSFTTLRSPSGVSLRILPSVTTWSRTVELDGRVRGAGVNGLTIALQEASFPFTAGYHDIATTRTNRAGEFDFGERPVYLATRFRAVPLIAPALTSREVAARVRSRVGIHRSHRSRRALRLSGHTNPALPTGVAKLQRLTRAGRWATVAEQPLSTPNELHSEYEFELRRLRQAKRYRVVAAARDGGAHARGYSRALLVGKRRGR
jgi:hypothetical protein